MTFKPGDKVLVFSDKDANAGTLPKGSIATVSSVYPDNYCEPTEVLLSGSNIYHYTRNIRIADDYDVAVAPLYKEIVTLREAGWDVEIILAAPVAERMVFTL